MQVDGARRIFGRWLLIPDPATLGVAGLSVEWVTLDVLPGVVLNADLENGYLHLEVAEEHSEETVHHCLFDLIVPRLLAYDGNLVIHGGLAFGSEGAVGLIGQSGRGKSTLVAGLHSFGLQLMGDDAFIIEPTSAGYDATRIYASLRLFPDSVDTLFDDDCETTLVANYSTKRRVPFSEGPETAPLLALFQLAEPKQDISVRRLSMAETCIALVSNSFVFDVDDIEETRVKFRLASEAAHKIPVYDLYYPRVYERLPEVYAAILDTLGQTPVQECAT